MDGLPLGLQVLSGQPTAKTWMEKKGVGEASGRDGCGGTVVPGDVTSIRDQALKLPYRHVVFVLVPAVY